MTEVKDTPQTGVEKKFKDVFGRSPGPFPEGASLEDKVKIIAKLNRELKAQKGRIAEGSVEKKFKDVFGRSPGPFPEGASLEDKVKTIAKLNQKLESRKSHAAEKVHQDFERIVELDRQYRGKGIFRSEKVAGSKSDKKLQDTPKKPTAEGKSFEQSGQKETSVQTDTQLSVNAEVQALSESKSQAVGFSSMSRSPIREKSSDKKPGLNKEDNVPQENQKGEGLFSFLKRFVKKVLEKLLGEDKKGVESTHNMEGAVQKNTLNNEMQQKSISQSSYVNINGKEFNLEPEKSFNYQDKALNISITYIGIVYISPETKQNLQQDTASPNIANVINLNISGKEYSVQPGESFNYKSPGLEISVVNGHQQSKHFDNILSQNRTISKGLEQVTTQLENSTITPVNTPEVDKISAGRER